jgi:predicted nucleic acid-binding Zn ribbon protein
MGALKTIALALPKAVADLGATRTLGRYQLQAAWETVCGPAISRQSEPTSIKGQTLFVRTSNPIWSQELLFRQGEILPRLNRLLFDSYVAKIHCKVGRLSRDPVPQSQAEPSPDDVDWAAVVLPVRSLERMAEMTRRIEDPTLRQSFEKALLQIERRRAWSYQNGLRPCLICADFQDSEICVSCELERLRERQQKLFRAMGRKSWATFAEMKDSFPDLSYREYQLSRRRLRSIFECNYRFSRESLKPGEPFPPELRSIILDLVMMSTGMDPENLKIRHFYYGLGKIWGKAYIDNVVPDIKAMNLKWTPRTREERIAHARKREELLKDPRQRL